MAGDAIDLQRFLEEFQDHLAPKLDTYEQALYLYCFRHTRLAGKDEAVIGFKSARRRIATGVGEAGKPMSEGTCYKKLQALAGKKCIELVDSTRDGTKLRVRLPSEIPGLIVESEAVASPGLEEQDFFGDSGNRDAIFRREQGRCFYCHKALDSTNWLIEHVVSRPEGDSSYRNVVAACRACNNRKGSLEAGDFLRELYRGGLLSHEELGDRLRALVSLKSGALKPAMP